MPNNVKSLVEIIQSLSPEDLQKSVKYFCKNMKRYEEWGFKGLNAMKNTNPFVGLVELLADSYEKRIKQAKQSAADSFEANLHSEHSLQQHIKQNPDDLFVIEDILNDYPRIIKKMEEVVSIAKTYTDKPIFKNKRLKEGEELLFFFTKKVTHKSKRFIIGQDEHKNAVGFDYAYLWNYDKYNEPFEWKVDAAYLITNTGLYKRKKRDTGYFTFTVKKIEEL